ncbi:DUF805 domain-containing protein [Lacticaseibacillus saniviri]|uniref:DUF805 domain-containing protein n=1 Tax=Lacticaseibacillus saniviri JCM 17471 = DSM 24301 TaxID=1293598 RepID=A0A0R2MRX8_9LACO|nr:DUF805 domain-containing protein [Lacticaseibacillus saniviri]KRO16343.1 hypothetical protein IV56_GL001124 [Lacticaseibacillus saniviri JCM 17471 = DSM 24301]MCG4282253.1 DUF805 domain-containing protein [Lacticaseibacillus saniviri]
MQEYREFWSKMFVWNASATRRQYWIPFFINIVIFIIISLVTGVNVDPDDWHSLNAVVGSNFGAMLIGIIFWIAEFSSRARRLHDSNHSNWWILLYVLPIIGWIWFFILLCLPSRDSRWPDNQSEV